MGHMRATKICSRSNCDLVGVHQSLDNFYPNKRTSDGKTSECKGCSRRIKRIYHQTPEGKETARIANARWQRSEKGKASHRKSVKKYVNTEKGRESLRKSTREWAKRNPEKVRAVSVISLEIRHGRMKPARELKCVKCGEQAVHYHHKSYEEEHLLDVIPLCRICHRKLDLLKH